jgi:hypothetical protein
MFIEAALRAAIRRAGPGRACDWLGALLDRGEWVVLSIKPDGRGPGRHGDGRGRGRRDGGRVGRGARPRRK